MYYAFDIYNSPKDLVDIVKTYFNQASQFRTNDRCFLFLDGDDVKQLALKILINGGYGVFGSRYFKYYDFRVANQNLKTFSILNRDEI